MFEFLVIVPRNEIPSLADNDRVSVFNDFESAVRCFDDLCGWNAELWMFTPEFGSWERIAFISHHAHVSPQITIG